MKHLLPQSVNGRVFAALILTVVFINLTSLFFYVVFRDDTAAAAAASQAGDQIIVIKRLVERALSQHGKLDILANVAGVSSRHDPIYTASLEEFNRITSINLAGTFLCIKHASAAMKERRYGRIVNVASIASFRTGAKGNAAYSASKGGVKAMTHQLVLDLSEFGITVNAVAPGVIQTPMTAGGGIERLNARARLIPLGRVGQPEDIAVAIAFLASEEAAFITGQMLTVDGGMTSVVYEAA